jgi:hypothetical protein
MRNQFLLGCAATALTLLVQPTGAQSLADQMRMLRSCSALAEDHDRLACYDSLLGRSPGAGASPSGKWEISKSVSPVDDSPLLRISLNADNELVGSLRTYRPWLALRCKEKTVDVFVVTGMVGADDETRVRYRIDKAAAVDSMWENSTDHKAIFYPGEPEEFIEQLIAGERMYFEVHPNRSSPTAASFDLRGLSNLLPELRSACP